MTYITLSTSLVDKVERFRDRKCFICGGLTWGATVCEADKRALQDWISHRGKYACNKWFERNGNMQYIRETLQYYRSKEWRMIRHKELKDVL